MTVLVLDIGSSSIRALLFDDRARLIEGAIATETQQFQTEPTGAATLDVLAVQTRVERCIDRILEHPAARAIRAVSVDTLVGNVLGISEESAPRTPVYTYADTRSAPDVEQLRARVDAEKKHQDTGCLLHTAYLPARLHWLRRVASEVFVAVDRWIDLGTYLYHQWFGPVPVSYSVASWNGLLNRSTLTWDSEWLEILGISERNLPPLADYAPCSYVLNDLYARRWPALRDVPWCLPVGDGAAANVGSGCVSPARVALTVGTTAALRIMTDAPLPPVPPGLWSYRVDREHHLIGGATSEGGNIFHWLTSTLRLPPNAELEQMLQSLEPDSHGLTFLPLLAGERSPGWATDATGIIGGLRLSTSPVEIAQAALEGVAHRLALIFEQLAGLCDDGVELVASGGALAASPAWAQMIANALNRPLLLTSDPELTARGSAILALRALGLADLDDFPPTIARVVQPQAEAARKMAEARARQQALYAVWV